VHRSLVSRTAVNLSTGAYVSGSSLYSQKGAVIMHHIFQEKMVQCELFCVLVKTGRSFRDWGSELRTEMEVES
jgi:hypothetical protein